MTHRGPRGNGLVTLRGVVTRDSESFGGRVSGPEGNSQGSSRTPTRLSRNREVRRCGGVVETRCGKGGKRKTPGAAALGVLRQLVGPGHSNRDRKAPRVGLEPTTNRLTAGCSVNISSSQSGTSSESPPSVATQLSDIVAAWPALPEPIRCAILALVESTRSEDRIHKPRC